MQTPTPAERESALIVLTALMTGGESHASACQITGIPAASARRWAKDLRIPGLSKDDSADRRRHGRGNWTHRIRKA